MVKKASAWAIRIDEVAGLTRSAIIDWCKKYNAVVCCREEPDSETPNPHYHIALRSDEVSQETIRNWTKKAFGDLPYSKSDFATSVWDGEENYLRYCCKGPDWQGDKTKQMDSYRKPDVIFTQLLIITTDSLHAAYWAENKARLAALVQKTAKKSPELVDEVVDQIRTKLASSEIEDDWLSKCSAANTILMDVFKGKCNDHIIFPILQSVMYQLDRKQTVANQFSRMLKKFSHL